jgi:predicted nucleic acid-binding protein
MTSPAANISPQSAQAGQYVVLDTSVWASSLLPNDRNHVAARDLIGGHISNGGQLVAPVLLVVETSATIARLTQNPDLARNAVSQLYSFSLMHLLPLDQELVDEAAGLAAQFSLKGMDSIYVAVAKRLGIPLVTFDKEQLTRPASIIQTIQP